MQAGLLMAFRVALLPEATAGKTPAARGLASAEANTSLPQGGVRAGEQTQRIDGVHAQERSGQVVVRTQRRDMAIGSRANSPSF